MTLAGLRHVLITVEPDLHRSLGDRRTERRQRGEVRALGLLAAEAAAHSRGLHDDPVAHDSENLGGLRLHLGRVLRRRVHEERAVLAGDDQRGVGLEIEVILRAAFEFALDDQRRTSQRSVDITSSYAVGFRQKRVGGERASDVVDRLERLVLDFDRCCGGAACGVAVGDDERHTLADREHFFFGEQRLVVSHRGDVVRPRNVVCGEDRVHAGNLSCGADIEARDSPAGNTGREDLSVEHSGGGGHVIDVDRLAGGVAQTAFVRGGLVQRRFAKTGHVVTPQTTVPLGR